MSTEKKFRKQIQQAVSAYKELLDTHCADTDVDIITQVTTQYRISRNALQQSFRKIIGMGIREYKLRMRMQRSRELLEARTDIKEIAIMLRYSKTRAFTSAFKRYYGVTPSDFTSSMAE